MRNLEKYIFYGRLYPADIIFVRSNTLLGYLIRWFSRYGGEEKTWTNHTAIVGLAYNVVEALTTVKSTPWYKWKKNHENYEVWRYKPFAYQDRLDVARQIEIYRHYKYGFLKILPHAIDGICGKILRRDIRVFRYLCKIKRYPICSWLASWGYWQKGVLIGGPPAIVSPDDQRDFVIKSDDWERLGTLTTNPRLNTDFIFATNSTRHVFKSGILW